MKRLATWVCVALGLGAQPVGAQDVLQAPSSVAQETVALSLESRGGRPVVGPSAWSDHELRLRRGWVAVENDLELRSLDLQALAAREEAERGDSSEGPQLADDGSIQFVYGQGTPTIFCRPLTVCDIALQEGERVVNWTSGTGKGGAWHVGIALNPFDPEVQTNRPHLVVRPKRPNAENTSLTIWTDRRSYHVDLVAAETPMRFVSFRYAEDEKNAVLATLAATSRPPVEHGTLEAGGPFSPRPWEWRKDYEIECVTRFWVCRKIGWMRPETVTDDGNVTQITLSREALSHPRPVFHVISPTGQRIQVNYSVHGRTYVIPQVFDEGSLIIAHGRRRRHILEFRIRRQREE